MHRGTPSFGYRSHNTILPWFAPMDRSREAADRKKILDRCLMMGADDLDEDLLAEILRRLPLKTVHHCKSVCKRWLSLISTPYFINQYVGFHRSVTPISSRYSVAFDLRDIENSSFYQLDIWKRASSSFKSLDFFFDFYPKQPEHIPPSFFDLVGSCNGLVLCRQLFRADFFHEGTKQHYYHVCNPITRDHRILPPPPPLSFSEVWAWDSVAFIDDGGTLAEDDFSIARGFKVVQIDGRCCDGDTFNVSIFSTSSGEWRQLEVLCKDPFWFAYSYSGAVVCCNRMLYWVGGYFLIGYDPYNMSNECSYIKLPSQLVGRSPGGLTIGANQGRIVLCDRYPKEGVPLCIWELKLETGSWCLKHQLDFNSVPLLLAQDCAKYHILAFHPFTDGDILYISEADYRIVCLDLKNRSVQFVAFSLPCCRAFPFFLPWWQTRLSDLKKLDEANSMNPGKYMRAFFF
ncbi:hypothetical protein Tsubulata_020842 [Turnera subulata]|uniref:F-box domain-containing protein n=1 Tax=Turnera subulata TaxID=218843 RepID=A0A9Q0FCW7_9ROSI|nr:hypothetical protein Tsubulata_020842 [Turnera subulata]